MRFIVLLSVVALLAAPPHRATAVMAEAGAGPLHPAEAPAWRRSARPRA